jgi:hypothetical protein
VGCCCTFEDWDERKSEKSGSGSEKFAGSVGKRSERKQSGC